MIKLYRSFGMMLLVAALSLVAGCGPAAAPMPAPTVPVAAPPTTNTPTGEGSAPVAAPPTGEFRQGIPAIPEPTVPAGSAPAGPLPPDTPVSWPPTEPSSAAPVATPSAGGGSQPATPSAGGESPGATPSLPIPVTPVPAPSVPAEAAPLLEKARQDAARSAGVAPDQVRVAKVEAVEWRDGSLGCPQPGMMYPQVITPGYRLLLEAGGKTLSYHADRAGRVFLCERPS